MKQLIQGWMLLSLLFSSVVYGTIQNPVPILRINAQNSNATEIGIAVGEQAKKHFPEIEKIYDRYLAELLSQEQFDNWVKEGINVLKPLIPDIYRKEVQGIAAIWTLTHHDELGDGLLSINELWLLQLLPDMGRVTQGAGFGVWGSASALKTPIVGRNLDIRTNQSIRKLHAITVYDYGHNSVVNIGFAGYVGTVTGFNDDGLFVAQLDSPLGRYASVAPPNPNHALVFDLRWVLQSQSYVRNAAHYLMRNRYYANHNILLADVQQVQVLEYPVGSRARLRTDTSTLTPTLSWDKHEQIAVVNCFALKTSPFNCNNTTDTFRWYQFKQFAQFTPQYAAHVNDVAEIMFDTSNTGQEIFNRNTLQSMVFTPEDKILYFYMMPIAGTHTGSPTRYQVTNLFTAQQDSSQSSLMFWVLIGASVLLVVTLAYGEYPRYKHWLRKS